MAEKLDKEGLVSSREISISNSVQIDAITQLFIETGNFTKDEFFEMLKRAQMKYKRKNGEYIFLYLSLP